jgi:hypothetical protein
VSLLSQYTFDHLDRVVLAAPMAILGLMIILHYLRAINYKNVASLNVTELVDKRVLDEKFDINSFYHKEGCHIEV